MNDSKRKVRYTAAAAVIHLNDIRAGRKSPHPSEKPQKKKAPEKKPSTNPTHTPG
jgi:hypothetical protein